MGELSLRSLFAFWTGVSSKNQVEQNPPSLVVLEGQNCTFQCNYTVSPFNNLRWYTQDTGRGLVSLISWLTVTTKSQMDGTQQLWMQLPSTAPCTSQLPSSAIQPSTSVWWVHDAPQALALCTQTCTWRLSRSIFWNVVCNFKVS